MQRGLKMPYIDESNRSKLDQCVSELILCLKNTVLDKPFDTAELSNEQLLKIAGNINYVFSRVSAGLMGTPSYPKIAIITGVLENIKQEFYRRIGVSLEERKIRENGDIPEYKKRC
jgi:hypothetical protein